MPKKQIFTLTRFYIFFLFLFVFFIKFSTTYLYANNYKIQNLEISAPYEVDFDKQNIIDRAFVLAFKADFKIDNMLDLLCAIFATFMPLTIRIRKFYKHM